MILRSQLQQGTDVFISRWKRQRGYCLRWGQDVIQHLREEHRVFMEKQEQPS